MKKTTALLTAGMLLVLSLTGCGVPANTVFKAEDLEGKTIGAQLGTTGYTFAETEVKDAKVEPYNKGADAVQALKQGKVDAVLIDSEPAKIFVEKNDTLRILDDPFVQEDYAIAYKKGNDELGKKLDDALTKLKNDGTLDEIVKHWIGDKVVGIDPDIMQAVCDELGMTLEIENMDFDAVLAAVESGKADVGVAGLSVTPDREKSVSFTQGYATSTQVIIVRKD